MTKKQKAIFYFPIRIVVALVLFKIFSVEYAAPYPYIDTMQDSTRIIAQTTQAFENDLQGAGPYAGFVGVKVTALGTGSDSVCNYLKLQGVYLDRRDTFFLDNNRYYLKHPVWTSVKPVKGVDVTIRKGYYVISQINIRLPKEGTEEGEKTVLIPLDQAAYTFWRILTWTLTLVGFVVLLFVFVRLPFKILTRIANGKVFLKSNITQLRIIAGLLIVGSIAIPLLQYLMFICFRSSMPHDISFPLLHRILKNWAPLLIGLAMAVVSIAFKRGYDLEQEQHLTI